MPRLLVALKAEAVLGLLLVVRHRAVRLTGLLAAVITALAAARPAENGRTSQTVLLVGGSLAAVAATRLLASGAALTAARWVGGPGWLAPGGRLVGAMLVVVPCTAVSALLLARPGATDSLGGLVPVVVVYSAAIGALALALTPLLGASSAATCVLLAAWLGGAPPATVAMALSPWPYARGLILWLWKGLPLEWRAQRWLASGGSFDGALLVLWIAWGIAVAAWATSMSPRLNPGRRRDA